MSKSLAQIAFELIIEYFDKLKALHAKQNIYHITVQVSKKQLELISCACYDYIRLGGNCLLAKAYFEVADKIYREIYIKYFKRGY